MPKAPPVSRLVRAALDNAVANGHEVWKLSATALAADLQRHDADLEDESLSELATHARDWLKDFPTRWLRRMPADVPPEVLAVYAARKRRIVSAASRGLTEWKITSDSGKTVVWKRTNNPAKPWRIGL
jgi:hypothetical protein